MDRIRNVIAIVLAVILLSAGITSVVYPQGAVTLVQIITGGAIVSNGNPLPVTGTFSAGGFVPSLSYITLTATASSSASTTLPTNTGTVAFQNQTSAPVSCTLSATSAVATTNEIIVPAGSTIFVGTTGYTAAACINQTGSASNVIILAGGSGLGTGFGGSSSGGGGTTNITQTAGTNINAAIAATGALPIDTLTTGNLYLATIAPEPVSVNGTAAALTGVTQGTTQTGTITAANNIDTPANAAEANISASTSGTPSTATTLVASNAARHKITIKVEGATAVCFSQFGTAVIGAAGTWCLKGASSANAGDGGSYVTPVGFTDQNAFSMISTGTSILVTAWWQ